MLRIFFFFLLDLLSSQIKRLFCEIMVKLKLKKMCNYPSCIILMKAG